MFKQPPSTAATPVAPVGSATPAAASSSQQQQLDAAEWLQSTSTRGAYFGEGADNGNGGRTPPPGTTGGGDRTARGGGLGRPTMIGRSISLQQSTVPSFHHVQVGLGGGYLVEVSRQKIMGPQAEQLGGRVNDEGYLRGIKLSRHMFSDHMPNRYEQRIQDCWRPRVEACGWVKVRYS